jgi:hypothetical protein
MIILRAGFNTHCNTFTRPFASSFIAMQILARKRSLPIDNVNRSSRYLFRAILGTILWLSPFVTLIHAQGQQELYPDAPPDDNRYYIGIPTFSASNLKVSLEYPVADLSPLEHFRFRIFDGNDCPSVNSAAADITNQTYLQTAIEPVDDFSLEGDGKQYRRMRFDVSFDPDTIRDSTILTEIPGELTATVGFCVQLQTMTAEVINPGAVPIFLRETYVTIDLAQDGNVAVEDAVDQPVGDPIASERYYLIGYICDSENVKIEDPEPIYMGQPIRVCVTPNEEAQANDVYMRAIEQFAWTRGTIHQQAIHATQMEAHLTEIECEAGMKICAFTTFLKMPFFYKLGWASGAGSGWLQFGKGDYTGDQRILKADIRMKGILGDPPDYETAGEDRQLQTAVEGPGSDGYAGGGAFVVEHPLARLYTAIGFLCDKNNTEIFAADYPLTHGMKARICVRPDALAMYQDDVRIRSIDRFVWERDDFNVSQVAITTNSQPEPKTEIFCDRGNQVCAFETELDEEFFRNSGIVEGKGIVWLQFGKDSRRNALGEEYGYEYELGFYLLPKMEAGFAGASPFDASVVVVPPKELRELYKCEAYECKGANNEKITPGEPVLQGASIRMCVEPSDAAKVAGANMWAIEWWDWRRKNFTQSAIVDQGKESPDGMTLQVCNRGDPICIFETRLNNMFFNDTGAMTGEGVCWLTFGKGEAIEGTIEQKDPEQEDPEQEDPEQDDADEEQQKIDPSKDALHAGNNPISYEFPVTGNYVHEVVCPEEDHQLKIWWEELDPIQRFLTWLSIVGTIASCCCLGGCCLLSAYRDARRDEEIETNGGKVTVNVDVGETTTNEQNKASTDGPPTRNQHYDGQPKVMDVLFGERTHPGTRACTRTIREYMRRNAGATFGPSAYRDIMNQIPPETTFLTRNAKAEPWRIATKHETIAYFGDIWKHFQK